jgi:hypothetical protein
MLQKCAVFALSAGRVCRSLKDGKLIGGYTTRVFTRDFRPKTKHSSTSTPDSKANNKRERKNENEHFAVKNSGHNSGIWRGCGRQRRLEPESRFCTILELLGMFPENFVLVLAE